MREKVKFLCSNRSTQTQIRELFDNSVELGNNVELQLNEVIK